MLWFGNAAGITNFIMLSFVFFMFDNLSELDFEIENGMINLFFGNLKINLRVFNKMWRQEIK